MENPKTLKDLAIEFALLVQEKEQLEVKTKLLNVILDQTGSQLHDEFINPNSDADVTSLTLEGSLFEDKRGRLIKPELKPKPRIAPEKDAAFARWCVENGHKGLITIELHLGSLPDELLPALRTLLSLILNLEKEKACEASAINYTANSQKLVSLVKTRTNENLPLPPEDILPVFEIRTASVRRLPAKPQKEEVVHE